MSSQCFCYKIIKIAEACLCVVGDDVGGGIGGGVDGGGGGGGGGGGWVVGLVWCGVVKGRSQKRKIATNSWNVVVVVLRVCVCRGEVRGLGWVARWGGRVRDIWLVAAPNAKNATCSRGAVGRVGGVHRNAPNAKNAALPLHAQQHAWCISSGGGRGRRD